MKPVITPTYTTTRGSIYPKMVKKRLTSKTQVFVCGQRAWTWPHSIGVHRPSLAPCA